MTPGGASSERVERSLERRLREIEHEIAGVTLELAYEARVLAGVNSDPELARRAQPAVRAALGDAGLVVTSGATPIFSEDFGFFLEEIPGAMFWLGVANPERGITGMPHSPDFAADEAAIAAGAKAMAAVLWGFLTEPDPAVEARAD